MDEVQIIIHVIMDEVDNYTCNNNGWSIIIHVIMDEVDNYTCNNGWSR